jgi:hypothetical protein
MRASAKWYATSVTNRTLWQNKERLLVCRRRGESKSPSQVTLQGRIEFNACPLSSQRKFCHAPTKLFFKFPLLVEFVKFQVFVEIFVIVS